MSDKYIGEEYFEIGVKAYKQKVPIGEDLSMLTEDQTHYWLKGWMSCHNAGEVWGSDNECPKCGKYELVDFGHSVACLLCGSITAMDGDL